MILEISSEGSNIFPSVYFFFAFPTLSKMQCVYADMFNTTPVHPFPCYVQCGRVSKNIKFRGDDVFWRIRYVIDDLEVWEDGLVYYVWGETRRGFASLRTDVRIHNTTHIHFMSGQVLFLLLLLCVSFVAIESFGVKIVTRNI